MKLLSKLLFFLSYFILGTALSSAGQDGAPSEIDEEFNLFLFSLAFVFICALIGAAIIGALAAIFLTLFLLGLVALGIVSTSVMAALYYRSLAAGFKSFLYFICSISCMTISTAGLLLLQVFTRLPLSNGSLVLTGALSGLAAGLLLGFCIYTALQRTATFIQKKLQTIR